MITLKEYIEKLQKIAKERPETLDHLMVYAMSESAQPNQYLRFGPTAGNWEINGKDVRVVCVN